MNLRSLKTPNMRRRRGRRVGRGSGSGRGKTCGRGQNGYYSRSGNRQKKAFEGGQMSLWRRLPKRGFNNYRHATRYAVVNVGDLMQFPEGSEVGWEQLAAAGLLPGRLGTRKFDGIKVLGEGDLDHALIVSAHRFSKTARAKLEAAGCTLVELSGRYRSPEAGTRDKGSS